MKKISIFIGSSIEQFREERMDLENFIHRLSNIFIDRYQVQLVPNVCEAQDTAMVAGRKQDEFNKLAQESDLCLFLFYTRAGAATLEEFHKAVEKFMDDGKPKIYVYFKNIHGDIQAEQSLKDFINEVDGKYKHYYGTFDHVDTLKLRILLALKYEEMDFLSVEINGDKCCVDGEDLSKEMLDLSKVNEFFNSEDLKNLLAHYDELNAEYERLLPIYKSGEGDAAFYKKYAKLCTERDQVGKDIDELRKNTFDLSLSLSKAWASGEMNARMAAAYRLLEKGDKQGCIDLLTDKQFKNDFYAELAKDEEHISKMQEAVKKRVADYISALKLVISTLKTMYSKKDRFVAIDELYKETIMLAEKYNVELEVLYDYTCYLDDQNHHQTAIKYAEKLKRYYNKSDDVSDDDIARLYNLLGNLYSATQRYKEAEDCYEQAVKIYKRLAEVNPEVYELDLATSYNNLGNLYIATQRYKEAEDCFIQALEIRKSLAEVNPEEYEPYLATSYNNLGNLYSATQRYKEAEGCYEQAMKIYKRLAELNHTTYASYLAVNYINFGNLYRVTQRHKKAEHCYEQALKIRKRLARMNPEAYDPDVATAYNNLGVLYSDIQRYEDAEKCYICALKINKRLSEVNHAAYDFNLAGSYNNFGLLYVSMQRYREAEDYYKLAIKICEGLAVTNPAVYNSFRADIYNNFGLLYGITKRHIDAERSFIRALEIRKELAAINPVVYDSYIAESYKNIGLIYVVTQRYEEAEVCYKHSLEIYEKLNKISSVVYDPTIAEIYNNFGLLYVSMQRYKEAEGCYKHALEIYKRLASPNPAVYNRYLALNYYTMAILYFHMDNYKHAEGYAKLALALYEKLAEKNYGVYSGDVEDCKKLLKKICDR